MNQISIGGITYTLDPQTKLYTDSIGNTYMYDDISGMTPVAASNGSNPYDINAGGYAQALESIAPTFTAKVAQTQSAGESWIDTAQRLLTAVTMTSNQRNLMNVNLERAKKGLPPIDINQYTGVGVNVGLAPQTQQLVMYGGIALLAIFLLNSLKKR